jgi:hypothetical protein
MKSTFWKTKNRGNLTRISHYPEEQVIFWLSEKYEPSENACVEKKWTKAIEESSVRRS